MLVCFSLVMKRFWKEGWMGKVSWVGVCCGREGMEGNRWKGDDDNDDGIDSSVTTYEWENRATAAE